MKKTITFFLVLSCLALLNGVYAQKTQEAKLDSINSKREAHLPGFTVNINPIGVALFGPIVEAEFKVANRTYLVPWIRYSYLGVVSSYNWTNFDDDSEYDASSAGFALGFKIFKPGDKKDEMIYWGGFVEITHESGLHNTGSDYQYEQTRNAVALYANVGYRWLVNRQFYLNLGILPGVAYDLVNDATFSNSGGEYPGVAKEFRFTGTIDLSFGWNLTK